MKLKNFFMLFIALTLTNLLQATYACTTINSSNLSAFKIAPRNSYKIIDSKTTYSNKRKAPKKNEPENIEEKYKRKVYNNPTTINPNNKEALTRTKCIQRYNQRCRCQKCYWTGYPSISKVKDDTVYYGNCGGCGYCGRINNDILKYWSEDNIPGIQLSLDFGKCSRKDNCPHNGFIFDKRLSSNHKISHTDLAKLKKTDEKFWFYCYSCEKQFFVPMNAIQHSEDIFNY